MDVNGIKVDLICYEDMSLWRDQDAPDTHDTHEAHDTHDPEVFFDENTRKRKHRDSVRKPERLVLAEIPAASSSSSSRSSSPKAAQHSHNNKGTSYADAHPLWREYVLEHMENMSLQN